MLLLKPINTGLLVYRILAHSYPNNEVRLTFSSLSRRKYLDSGEIEAYPISWQSQTDNEGSENGPEKFPPLSLVPDSKTQPFTTGYGALPSKPTAFGPSARRKIMRAGGALEKSISSPSECLFLTATLPGSTEASFRAIAEWSGYIVNSLKSWIANHITAKLDFYVWEYQRRGALHLHYCVHAQDENARNHIQRGFKDWWISILHRVGEKSLTDLFRKNDKYTHLSDVSKVRAVAEICRKSPARYLAKYLSKSTSKLKGRAQFFTPSRWWGTSRPLKKLLNDLTEIIEIVEGSYFGCIKKLQEVKSAFESCEGRYFPFNHKYGLGETLLIYPSSAIDNTNLIDEIKAMTTLSKIEKASQHFKPSTMLKPHKTRLLNWSGYWMAQLPIRDTGIRNALKEFNDFLNTVVPSKSREPLQIIYEWNNRLYNLRELAIHSPCGRNRDDRLMIDRVLTDLEIAIKHICLNGWQ